jgi:N-acetylglucosaminyl-diphospho-decaprenol L-rhamnosyltransferase
MGEPMTVVAVTYSPGPALRTFVDTLRQATSEDLEIVLVDNGSTDGSVEEMVGHDGVRLIRAHRNVGYGVAANLGVRACATEFVVVANPDVTWHPRALDTLRTAADRWPDGGAFGPLVITAEGDIYPSARCVPSLGTGIGHALLGWAWPTNPWTKAYRVDGQEPCERVAGWLSGCCILLRRSAFEEVGGFDPGFFMYFEDVDLGERLADAGWRSVYVPSATITHTRAHATSRDVAKMAKEHHRSAWRYLQRRYSGPLWLPVRAILHAGIVLRSVLAQRVPRLASGAGAERQWLGNGDSSHVAATAQREITPLDDGLGGPIEESSTG